MKVLRIILVLIFVVLIALILLLRYCDKPKQPEVFEAIIQVIDADTKEPLEGARVKVKTTDEYCLSETMTTDDEGYCSFEYSDGEETMTSVIAHMAGYENARVDDLELSYFEDDELVIPLRKHDIVEQGEEVGGNGKLKVTLLWNDPNIDLDLHVIQPTGTEIYFMYTDDTITGAHMDRDWIPGNEVRPIGENIFWENPTRGQYKVSVECYNPDPAPITEFTVIVYREGQDPAVYNMSTTGYKDRRNVATININ